MNDQEQLAGYDDDRTDRTPEPRALETPPSVPAASSPELRTLVAVAVGAIVVATLYIAQDVLIPITLAIMLSFVLSPLVDVLRRIGLWRAAAVGLSVLVALGAIGLIGTLLGSQAATLAADVPQYVEAVQSRTTRPFPADRGPSSSSEAILRRRNGGAMTKHETPLTDVS